MKTADMAAIRELSAPPIVEAVLDLRVLPNPAFDASAFREAREALQSRFPKSKEQRTFEAELRLDTKETSARARDLGLGGILYLSEDERSIAQFRIDGYSYNRLEPYPGWDEFFEEAIRAWDIYVGVAHPNGVTRAALRYINRMSVKTEGLELSKYLTTEPRIPQDLPQTLSSFNSRVTIEFEGGRRTHLNLGLKPGSEGRADLVVDIDAFTLLSGGVERDGLRECLLELRTLKNRVFFAAITEHALERYK
jgi:uncharacterized protein (TIGR04255 family)